MKVVKIKKAWLRDCITLLRELDLVKGDRCFPDGLYLSKEDYTTLKSHTKKAFKKDYPHISARGLDSSVSLHWLNYGPNEGLGNVIKPGYAVITKCVVMA